MIKRYKDFIMGEGIVPTITDSPENISNINSMNQIEKDIKEFNSKKTLVTNIYLTYIDENDLINKLTSQKFIDSKSRKDIKFHNHLKGMWAQVCSKRREINNINNEILKWEKEIQDSNSNIRSNPSSKESIESQISLLKERILLKKKELVEKNTEILNLEKIITDKIKVMKNDLLNSKKRIDISNLNKF